MTPAMEKALEWFRKRGGDGMFDKNGVFLCAGELAPHTRTTWNRLAKEGLVEFYNPTDKGRGRMRIVDGNGS
jgi:hypothetical protein